MTVLAARPAPDRISFADRLWVAAHAILGAMPVVMAVAHRSSPLVLALALAATLAAIAAEGRAREWLAEGLAALATPLGLAVLAFLGLAALSMTWSVALETSFATLVEFSLTLGAAVLVAFVLPRRMPQRRPLALATSIGLACAIIVAQLWTDSAVRRAVALRSEDFIYNRPSLTVLVLTIPLAWMLIRGGHRRVGAVVLAIAGATILQSSSGAAVLGLVAALAAYALARYAGRVAVLAVAIGIAGAIVLAPVMGVTAERLLPPAVHDNLAKANSRARVEIWKKFGEAVRRDPVLGAGFGVSPRYRETRAAQELAPGDPSAFAVWHPHNAALQVWVELGVVGAALGLIVVMLTLARIARLPGEMRAVSLALVAAMAAVSLVGHGAWQGWWPAAIGAAVVWLRASREVLRGSDDRL